MDLGGVVELAHLVAVVSDQLQQRETLARGLHLEVQLPRQPGLGILAWSHHISLSTFPVRTLLFMMKHRASQER